MNKFQNNSNNINYLELKDNRIYFKPLEYFENCALFIKNLNGDILYYIQPSNYIALYIYYFIIEDKSYLRGFIFELYQNNKLKYSYKYTVDEPEMNIVIDEKEIAIFHHCYLINNWKNIVKNQIFLMKRYGLYENCSKIFVTIYSENSNNYNEFKRIIKNEDYLNKWNIVELYENNHEYESLKSIKDYCESNDAYICYFHTKGVTSENIEQNIDVKSWRNYFNYFTINKWQENIRRLNYNDIVCCLNIENNNVKTIDGNFFWTKSEYVKSLIHLDNENQKTWLFSNENVKIYENFNRHNIGYTNLYSRYFDPYMYRDDLDNIKVEEAFEKNKTIYIITSHPNFKMSEDITIRTLSNLKSFGEDIILSSHCPVSQELQKLSNYFIYDKNNPLIEHDFYTNSWFNEDYYFAHLNITKLGNNTNHALGVFLNYYNSILLAKNLGYKTAVCTNFDMVFSAEDKKVIDDRIYQMLNKNKKAYFLNTPQTEGIHYKTIFFITDVDYFLNTFNYIKDEKNYIEELQKVDSNTNCLENFFYHALKLKTEDLLLEEINEGELFKTSEINLFSLIEYNTILPVDNQPDKFIYWFSSANSLDSRNIKVNIIKNNEEIYEYKSTINNKFIFYKKIKFTDGDYFEIRTQIFNSTEILKDTIIVVDNNIFHNLETYGRFVDKINIDYI